jgi:hypothetical protein
VLRPGSADFSQVGANGTVYDSGTITCVQASTNATALGTTITVQPADPMTDTSAEFAFSPAGETSTARRLDFVCRLDSQEEAA